MSYSEPLINQIRVLFLSVGVGVPLSLLYIALQGATAFFGRKRWAIYTFDIVFCVVSAFISFFFMVLYNDGRVRLHLIIGEAIGFFAFYLSVGRYLLRLCEKTGEILAKGLALVLSPFVRVGKALKGIPVLFRQCCGKNLSFFGKVEGKKKKSRKKIKFLGKIHLKNQNKSV